MPLEWSDDTELVGIALEVVPKNNATLIPQYVVGLHAWFLDQVRALDPLLSASLHDDESQKPFTLSGLAGNLTTSGSRIQLFANQSYRWYISALSPSVVGWLNMWLQRVPERIELRSALLQIQQVKVALPPTTYRALFERETSKTLSLNFLTPTSFRHKGHHLPLPLPVNVFHSYLRRWNMFSGMPFEAEAFLTWVDECVVITRHQLYSEKVAAGKRGMVTGFRGWIELSLTAKAYEQLEFVQLFCALGQFAPYCGTGHKTPFGLGQTRLERVSEAVGEMPSISVLLAQRIEQLTEQLMQTQKRTGGERALSVCQTRATILARREFGESLVEIAKDLEMPYETVKTYAKLARRLIEPRMNKG